MPIWWTAHHCDKNLRSLDDYPQGGTLEEPASLNDARSTHSKQAPLALDSPGATAAHAEKASNDKTPDIPEVIKTWLWRLATEKLGKRCAMAGLVAVFIGGLIWGFYPDKRAILSGAQICLREANRALEEACLARFGTSRPRGSSPVVRSDNGLIFQSRAFALHAPTTDYARSLLLPTGSNRTALLSTSFVVSRRSVSGNNLRSFTEAGAAITGWME
jgi:putative transposase